VIDLHTHTTASDGRSAPSALVAEARAAGITVLAVTDHDTMASWTEASAAARDAGITPVPGIEITAVHRGRDVHVLGYFHDPAHAGLAGFLAAQRADRRRRAEEILRRLEAAGVPLDPASVLDGHPPDRAIGRPLVAAALVQTGHVASIAEAFDRYLSTGRPGFVPRTGAPPERVIEIIEQAGGVASLAHPGKVGDERLVDRLAAGRLRAIEVHHPDHAPEDVERYSALARREGLVMTGGSDYHGPGSGRTNGLGRVTLPRADFERLRALAPPPSPLS
jgi:predicted metal-dependent phosphoesterase TrpH